MAITAAFILNSGRLVVDKMSEKPVALGLSGDPVITFFVPCFNEETRVTATLETLKAAVSNSSNSYEVIVVDDGSTDNTARVVNEYCLNNPNFPARLHRNASNLGLAQSFVDAAFEGKGRYFRLICGDNIEPAESIISVLSHLGEADIIIPYYPKVPGKGRFRLVLSGLYTNLVNAVSGFRLKYYNGNPLYLRDQVIRWAPRNYGFGYQADLLTQLIEQNASFVEVPIQGMHRQKAGSSSIKLRNLLSVGHSLLEIFLRRIRRELFPRNSISLEGATRSKALLNIPAPTMTLNNVSTREAQYQRSLDLLNSAGLTSLGLMTNQAWEDDPKHLVFTLARYKFVSKIFAQREHVLEVGCADAFGTRIVRQAVQRLTATDFDPTFIADVNARMNPKWEFECRFHDMLAGPVKGVFDAVFALDVIEHIAATNEALFLKNMSDSISEHGAILLGCPSLASQMYASPQSKAGHINCKDGQAMRSLLSTMFHNVFVFSMNDEVVHTGFFPMAHYIIGLGCGKKNTQ